MLQYHVYLNWIHQSYALLCHSSYMFLYVVNLVLNVFSIHQVLYEEPCKGSHIEAMRKLAFGPKGLSTIKVDRNGTEKKRAVDCTLPRPVDSEHSAIFQCMWLGGLVGDWPGSQGETWPNHIGPVWASDIYIYMCFHVSSSHFGWFNSQIEPLTWIQLAIKAGHVLMLSLRAGRAFPRVGWRRSSSPAAVEPSETCLALPSDVGWDVKAGEVWGWLVSSGFLTCFNMFLSLSSNKMGWFTSGSYTQAWNHSWHRQTADFRSRICARHWHLGGGWGPKPSCPSLSCSRMSKNQNQGRSKASQNCPKGGMMDMLRRGRYLPSNISGNSHQQTPPMEGSRLIWNHVGPAVFFLLFLHCGIPGLQKRLSALTLTIRVAWFKWTRSTLFREADDLGIKPKPRSRCRAIREAAVYMIRLTGQAHAPTTILWLLRVN